MFLVSHTFRTQNTSLRNGSYNNFVPLFCSRESFVAGNAWWQETFVGSKRFAFCKETFIKETFSKKTFSKESFSKKTFSKEMLERKSLLRKR